MKKELSSRINSLISSKVTNVGDLVPNATNSKELLPIGVRFQFLSVVNVKANGNLPAYQTIVIELDNGIQQFFSFNTLKGVKRVADVSDNDNPFNRVEIEETFFNKSGLDVLTFINTYSEKWFKVIDRIPFQTVIYGTNRLRETSLIVYVPETENPVTE